MSARRLARLLAEKRVVVVCGAGGVGKTTTSASLALAAARAGRRVLVITIDPSKRLAQTLGVSPHELEPHPLPAERQRAVGIEPPGGLSAWMLDPQAVSDRTVRRLSADAAAAERLLENRIYRHITSIVAGMQEYTAVEALHGYVRDDRYDLVILDTPPSRDALRFLEAPSRATAFLDQRILRLFLPGSENRIRQAATKLFEGLLDRGLGAAVRQELQQFLLLFEQVLQYLNRSQGEMRDYFSSPDVIFLLVSSPRAEALEEAFYFEERTRALSLPLAGYILNRSRAFAAHRPMPSEVTLPADAPAPAQRALEKLEALALPEARSARDHERLRGELAARAGGGLALALPELPAGASDLESLVALADQLEAGAQASEG
ncbi:MAG: ArsA-related P-loop ATPase [Myxococcota bacterium]|nr:ArsA-related P-loop ATPase [Myxococcota bacterium]